jgi:hypothetical protein
MNENETEYSVNLDCVIDTEKYILASDVAMLVKMNGMMNVGSILKSIENEKLSMLVQHIEDTFHQEDPSDDSCHEELMILSLVMLQAEGGYINFDVDLAAKYMGQTVSFLMMESLFRQGLIELMHDNLSFDEAAGNRMVARATPAGRMFNERNKDD